MTNASSPAAALLATWLLLGVAPAAWAADEAPIVLRVDASRFAERIVHAESEIPVVPGPLTLVYPRWIPGEHGPTGPLTNLVDLHFTAGGAELPWQRDALDMFALHLTVPPGVSRLATAADFLYTAQAGNFTSGPSATTALGIFNWNSVALYPAGASGERPVFAPALRVPAGWSAATALEEVGQEDGFRRFAPVSLATLVDSPVLTGLNAVDLDLGVEAGAPHHLSIVADRGADLTGAKELTGHMQRLVAEAHALFGVHHYTAYRWLLALSDHVQHFGLEHHESSDNRREEETLVDPVLARSLPGLLAHEYVHSWNGKHRRPAGLLSPDFQRPMDGSLLWVYEGLTQYLGQLLPVRAGFWTPEQYREQMAASAAGLDAEVGRRWRSLGDTAVAAQVLFASPSEGRVRRRGTDFYAESVFLWLDVDTLLRERSGGKLSLDDFCRRFHGGPASAASVRPYDRGEVVSTLNALLPYDWAGLFARRVDQPTEHLAMDGVERAGWRLAWSAEPNTAMQDSDARGKGHDWRFSLGFAVNREGEVGDVLPESPAGRLGLTAGAKLLAIGGYVYSPRAVEAALLAAQESQRPIELIVAEGDLARRLEVPYFAGPRYPHLERIAGAPDRLSEILAPRRPPTATP